MRSVLGVLVIGVLLVWPAGAREATSTSSGGPLVFAAPISIPKPHEGILTEPNVALTPDGSVFVSSLGFAVAPVASNPQVFGIGESAIYRLSPGDSTFMPLPSPDPGFGGLDLATATRADGRLMTAAIYRSPVVPAAPVQRFARCISVSYSDDLGITWVGPNVLGCRLPQTDRPWTTFDEHGAAWFYANGVPQEGVTEASWSPDGGATVLPGGVPFPVMAEFPGNLVSDRVNGFVYAFTTCDVPAPTSVCASRTPSAAPLPAWEPLTRIPLKAANRVTPQDVGAVDDAGNLYVVWTDAPTTSAPGMFVARSTDGGSTWTPPVRISGPNLAVLPWITAGSDGNVAVAWYEADRPAASSNDLPSDVAWNVVVAEKLGGWEVPSSGWERVVLTPAPNHFGSICLLGGACAVGTRSMGDFFELRTGPDGRIHLAWSDDTKMTIDYAVQTGGPRLR